MTNKDTCRGTEISRRTILKTGYSVLSTFITESFCVTNKDRVESVLVEVHEDKQERNRN